MVAWTAEKDQIILNGIFKFCDIKNSAPLLDFLAKEIGEGCTPKAVSHRLNHIRNGGKANGKNGSVKKTPVKPNATQPKITKFASNKKSKKKTPDVSEDSDENEEIVSPSVARAKRGRAISYVGLESSDEETDAKRVKVEKDEDENEDSFVDLENYFEEEDNA